MSDNLILTMASRSYIPHFHSLVGNLRAVGKWAGDIAVIAMNWTAEEIAQHEDMGFIVVDRREEYNYLADLNAFDVRWKRWRKVWATGPDVVIYKDVNPLFELTGFHADNEVMPISAMFDRALDPALHDELVREVGADTMGFCAGEMLFETSIITPELYDELLALHAKYRPINPRDWSQSTINVRFAHCWTHLWGECFIGKVTPDTIVGHTTGYHSPWSGANVGTELGASYRRGLEYWETYGKQKFVVYAPNGFFNAGGVRALYLLNTLLNKLGHKSRIVHYHTESTCSDDTIAVYPESESGNPLNARMVVRYGLNTPGAILGGDAKYPESELVVFFAQRYREGLSAAWGRTIPDENDLRLMITEPELFYDDGKEKTEVIAYLGKGPRRLELPEPATLITHEFCPTRELMSALMRKSKRVYSFDSNTTVFDEALMCGAELYIQGEAAWVRHTGGYDGRDLSKGYNRSINLDTVRNFVNVCKRRWAL